MADIWNCILTSLEAGIKRSRIAPAAGARKLPLTDLPYSPWSTQSACNAPTDSYPYCQRRTSLRREARMGVDPNGRHLDWRDRSRSFESMAAFTNTDRTLTALDRPVTLFAHEVTPNLFDVAGVQAFRGRTFLPDEGLQGKDDVAPISYALWRSTFGGSESLVGPAGVSHAEQRHHQAARPLLAGLV